MQAGEPIVERAQSACVRGPISRIAGQPQVGRVVVGRWALPPRTQPGGSPNIYCTGLRLDPAQLQRAQLAKGPLANLTASDTWYRDRHRRPCVTSGSIANLALVRSAPWDGERCSSAVASAISSELIVAGCSSEATVVIRIRSPARQGRRKKIAIAMTDEVAGQLVAYRQFSRRLGVQIPIFQSGERSLEVFGQVSPLHLAPPSPLDRAC